MVAHTEHGNSITSQITAILCINAYKEQYGEEPVVKRNACWN